MDDIDRKVCEIVQADGRASTSVIAEATGVPASTANDRLRRLVSNGTIKGWHAALDPQRVGAGLAGFVLIEMDYEGETEAAEALAQYPEVLELHHVSGPYSYLLKLRLQDMEAMQDFLAEAVKPLAAVRRTETIFAMQTLKETAAVRVATN